MSGKLRLPFALFMGALTMLGVAGTATSADLSYTAQPVDPSSKWRLSFTPYGWLTFLDGSTTVKGRTVDLNVDPIQVLEHLERVPFMGYAEARKRPLILYSDIFYANLGLTAEGVGHAISAARPLRSVSTSRKRWSRWGAPTKS